MKIIISCLASLLLIAAAQAQILPEGPNLADDPYTGPIETPEEPPNPEPPPPALCGMGDLPPGEASCNPVSDWWCALSTACNGTLTVAYAEVYAPAFLSPLGFDQPWHDHWLACKEHNDYLQADLAAHQYEIHLWRTGQLVYEPPNPEVQCDVMESWSGGDLWKPISDNTGAPVVLIGDEFAGRSCEVHSDLGEHPCRFRTCCPNGGRAHFDVLQSCNSFGGPVIFRVVLNGVSHCWNVPDACQRYD